MKIHKILHRRLSRWCLLQEKLHILKLRGISYSFHFICWRHLWVKRTSIKRRLTVSPNLRRFMSQSLENWFCLWRRSWPSFKFSVLDLRSDLEEITARGTILQTFVCSSFNNITVKMQPVFANMSSMIKKTIMRTRQEDGRCWVPVLRWSPLDWPPIPGWRWCANPRMFRRPSDSERLSLVVVFLKR